MARAGDNGASPQGEPLRRESALVRSIYYGRIGREDAERLLERYGREGSFLLRDSESLQGVYCLCVRRTPYVHTYRLHHSSDGWTLEGSTGGRLECFGTLDRLIESYKRTVAPKLPPLTHPLDKTQLGDDMLEQGEAYMEM